MTLSERIGELVGRDKPGRPPLLAFALYAAEQSSDTRLAILCGLIAGHTIDDGAIAVAARAILIHGGWSPTSRQWLDDLDGTPEDGRAHKARQLVIEHHRLRSMDQ